MPKIPFSNGTEYMIFNEEYCCRCKRYVPWEEATEDNPVCPIEDKLSEATLNESVFPHKQVKLNDKGYVYCILWEIK